MDEVTELHSTYDGNIASIFGVVEDRPSDPIFGLWSAYQRDHRRQKVNLCVGFYLDESGRIPLLPLVARVEAQLANEKRPKSYLPMEGSPKYRELVSQLVFGSRHQALCENRIATVQTLGGSGAVRVGAEFLQRHFPKATVYLSEPTWDNHRTFFQAAGMQTGSYPYYDPASGTLRFEEMLQAFLQMPLQSVVVMQPCCHNPTGVDLTTEQWDILAPVLLKRQVILFMDMAYQGFGQSLEEDTYAIKLLADSGVNMLVSTSFSKNLAVYSERCGALSVVCESKAIAERVLSQLKYLIRGNYSSPPIHGSLIVEQVLSHPPYHAEWASEVDMMRDRVQDMRRGLHDRLLSSRPHLCAELLKQRGMFSLLRLSEQQVDVLREEFGIYILRSGRCCLAALTSDSLPFVADALASVTDSQTYIRGKLHA
jgi:aromatic-amino-acid transaminase